MVRIIHEFGKQHIEGEGDGLFVLTDKKGSFFSACGENLTKYNGLQHYDPQHGYVKSLERLSLPAKITTVINRVTNVERQYDNGAVETYWMSSKSLHYTVKNYHGQLEVVLDMRRDEKTEGRVYHVTHEDDVLLIRYEQEGDYVDVLAIKGVHGFTATGTWSEERYAYDERRKDKSAYWVYHAGTISVEGEAHLIIARGHSAEHATTLVQTANAEESHLQNSIEHYAFTEFTAQHPGLFAHTALDALVTNKPGEKVTGIFAGLPWFTQYWSRDELISLGALIRIEKFGLVKEILTRYYELLDKPLQAHYPSGGLLAADSLGWLAKRTLDLLQALDERGIRKKHFTRLELAYIKDRMATAVEELLAVRGEDGLVRNGPGETWMDAAFDGDHRAGIRVEIQALTLACYRLLRVLDEKWHEEGHAFAERARTKLYREGRLLDGVRDETTRPNVFIAYYVYPELLSAAQWKKVFDDALAKLWCSWGGLASIDTNDPRYCERYSGADDKSYHRGDSWYWINALAAICLKRLDAKKWQDAISQLKDACLNDLLWQGALGHCSELSSAKQQEWAGTFSQAWSAALLYELLTE